MEPGSFLFEELNDLDRLQRPLDIRLNSRPAARRAVFTPAIETMTVQLAESELGPSAAAGAADSATTWQQPELASISGRSLDVLGAQSPRSLPTSSDGRFTVFDQVYHYRVFTSKWGDSWEDMLAKAISLSPQLPQAYGALLHGGADGLPRPHFVLRTELSGTHVLPVVHASHPLAICTVEVPIDFTAFQIAYRSRIVLTAQTRIVVLAGHSPHFRPRRRRTQPATTDPVPRMLVARELEDASVGQGAEAATVAVLQARGPFISVSANRLLTLASLRHHVRQQEPTLADSVLLCPQFRPALPSYEPLFLAVPRCSFKRLHIGFLWTFAV